MTRFWLIGRRPGGPLAAASTRPDWVQADVDKIEHALARALSRPTGGWVVVDQSRAFTREPRAYRIAGRDLVGWRCKRGPALGPDACPHMGAEMSKGHVDAGGRIVCPWHGLALSAERKRADWEPTLTYDDGVLTWARFPSLLSPGETLTERPIVPERPARGLDAVIRTEAECAPEDVIANRLDPWHGAHFHPHSFARLSLLEETETSVTVRVVYRIAGNVGMEVDACFTCPDARTIVMHIVQGEGVGSVVETHATPIDEGRTAIIEATIATSERPEVSWLPAATFLRPMIEARARRLWVDDVAYCERRYALRQRGITPRLGPPELLPAERALD